MKRLRTLWRRDERGATAVEFALVSVVFMVTLFGFIETARVLWYWNSVQYCVSKGGRYYLTHKTISDSALGDYIKTALSNVQIDSSKLNLTITKSTASGINFIDIDGSYAISLFGYMSTSGLTTLNLTVTTRLPVDSSAS